MPETTKQSPIPNLQLRYERERRCWSQQELADKVGTTPLNVSRWERGITLPSPYFRQKLCEIFEKSPHELGLLPESTQESKPADAAQPLPSSPALSTQETPTSFWNVPYNRNLLFTGREDVLGQIRAALNSEEQPIALSQPQAISGLGGIGKTQTAVEYAYRYRDTYNAVFWARADSYDLLVSDFLLIASLLNLPQRNEQDQSVVVNAVKRWFDTHEHWLLILDNADDIETVSGFIPSTDKGHILLTTRAHSTGTVAQRIELDKMGLEEGTLFLLRRAKLLKGAAMPLHTVSEAVRSQAQAIVGAVDGLPLALDQAGAYIEETGCSLSDYLKFYKTRRSRLLRMRGRNATGHPEPVATTWSLSFEKVEQANPAAAELLRLCAFLHPDEIPEAMIAEGAAQLDPILQPVVEDELELNEAIGELRKYSLVKRDPDTKMLNIHRLVQAVIKDAMDKETQQEWAERIVSMVNQAFPNSEQVDTWPICQQYLPHARLCAELIERWKLLSAEAASLLIKEGAYLCNRGLYSEAVGLIQQALILQELMLGKDHYDTVQSLNALALLYFYQGKYESSITLLQRVLAIREQALGPDHPDITQSLNDLGVLYSNRGKYEEAEQFLQRALAIREQIKGPDHPDMGESLYNLGTLYSNWGKYEQAIFLLRRALTVVEQAFGPIHPNVTHCLRTLAMIYKDQGKYEEALSLSQQSLTICEQVFGPVHPDVATSLNNLAILYRKQGMYAQAELLHQRALAIREQVFGHNHPNVANSLNNLGTVYRDQGRYEQVEPLYQRALAIRENILGPNHPEVANSLNNLGILYREQRKYEQAELFFQRALLIFEQNLVTEHPDVALTLENYADLLHKMGRETEVITLEVRAQAIRAQQK